MKKHPPRKEVGTLPWAGYWLDIYGPSGSPAHSKVLSTIGFWFAWAVLFIWALKADSLDGNFVAALGAVLVIPFGLDGYKSRQKHLPENSIAFSVPNDPPDPDAP